MKEISMLLCLLLMLSCNASKNTTASAKEYITIEGQTFEAFAGPNLVRISSNFYADQTEVTNLFYKEFMHWTKMTYGINSQEYTDILPDLGVWNYQNHVDSIAQNYFYSAELDDHPVVGITLNQAKIYANWRTERVAEMLLIEKGIINPNLGQNRDNCFTIERFINGNYPLRKELKKKILYPRFIVPTLMEWHALSGINTKYKYGIDSLEKHNKKFIERGNLAFHTLEDLENGMDKKMYKKQYPHSFHPYPTRPTQYGSKNIYGLHHTIGNVAEMVDSFGIAKGGDWMHSLHQVNINEDRVQNIPNCWTGLRCVASLKILQ